MSEQAKVLSYIDLQLIGPRGGKNEYIEAISPSDLYLMGKIHPIENNDDLPIDDNEKQEGFFQSKPPSFGLSFYLKDGTDFTFSVSCAQYIKDRIIDLEILEKMILRAKGAKPKDDQIIKKIEDLSKSIKDNKININDTQSIKWLKKLHKDLRIDKSERVDKKIWQRVPYSHQQKVSKPNNIDFNDIYLFDDKVRVNILWRPYKEGFITTVSMINHMQKQRKKYVENQLFQSKIKIFQDISKILPYPVKNKLSYDEEEEELALRYRINKTFVIGHSCAASYQLSDKANQDILSLSSEFLPTSIVKPVTLELENETNRNSLNLQFLCDKKLSSEKLESSLTSFVKDYEDWLIKQEDLDTPKKYDAARIRILERIKSSISRMKAGVETIASNPKVFEAFQLANLAMLMQMVHGSYFSKTIKNKDEKPFLTPDYFDVKYSEFNWRPFQLAFILLTMESLVNEKSPDRNVVDLIWFPTGGGKTEAYLAVSAFELFYRRIKYGEQGAGTVVIKRYPLRLLSAQQFERASILICACELIRRKSEKLLGLSPYSIGLWVGNATSPNVFSSHQYPGALELYQTTLEESEPENRFVVQKCPWCGTKIIPSLNNESSHYGVRATTHSFSFNCPSNDCDFNDKLPLSVVDDDLYKNPPSFIIATIDKFARMAWTSRPKAFFGIDQNTRPPSLIIQDEMHLISGPLGTISGLYEAAIDEIIKSRGGMGPKMIAATATIRRADEQIKRLYALKGNVFPSTGINADDSYFARTDENADGRMYIGVMGQSDTQITSMIQVSAVLAQLPEAVKLSDEAKDAYWTQIVYHNSMKELAKTMNTAFDDIPNRLKIIFSNDDKRRKLNNIAELSSNIKGGDLTSILERMNQTVHDNPNGAMGMLASTNMISVGVDVPRVGLMLINGQPKTTSEYIQASSRVGRGEVPGVVVTVYPSANPRARSHYESFIPYHESLYKSVEPTSVTPYAEPARDRALHAALVILIRYVGGIGENEEACLFDSTNDRIRQLIENLTERMQRADESEKIGIKDDMQELVGKWDELKKRYTSLRYESKANQFKTLLIDFEKRNIPNNKEKWPTLNSMRNVDVEIDIQVWGERAE